MICILNCQKTKCLTAPNACAVDQDLTLGLLAPSTDYTIYIEDLNNKAVKAIDVTSNVGGIITINMSNHPGFFHANTTYQLWVTLKDAGLTDVEDITQDGEVYTCLILEFQRVTTDGGFVVGLGSQNIEVWV